MYPVRRCMCSLSTNSEIIKLFLAASDVSTMMLAIYKQLTMVKSRVSAEDFLIIIEALPLPFTHLEVLDPVVQQGRISIDELRVCDPMPNPNKFDGNESTIMLLALVRHVMQNNLFSKKKCISYCTLEFSLNGAELSLNSVNSGNSENLRNHWSMNWVQYKDLLC